MTMDCPYLTDEEVTAALAFPLSLFSVSLLFFELFPKYWSTACTIDSDNVPKNNSTNSLFDIAAGGLANFFASARNARRKAYKVAKSPNCRIRIGIPLSAAAASG